MEYLEDPNLHEEFMKASQTYFESAKSINSRFTLTIDKDSKIYRSYRWVKGTVIYPFSLLKKAAKSLLSYKIHKPFELTPILDFRFDQEYRYSLHDYKAVSGAVEKVVLDCGREIRIGPWTMTYYHKQPKIVSREKVLGPEMNSPLESTLPILNQRHNKLYRRLQQ